MRDDSGSFWARWGVPAVLLLLGIVMLGLIGIAIGVAVGWIPWS